MPTRLLAHRPLLVAIALISALSGCASMSEKECAVADWHEQGTRDALGGYARTRLEDNRQACAKIGVTPDETAYFAGYNTGLQQFCLPGNAAEWGRNGRLYHNSCPAAYERDFLYYYQIGRDAYDAQQKVSQLSSEQRVAQRELEKAKDDEARKKLREKLADLDNRLRYARDELDRAERRYQNP